jgi:hypothetical protein
MEFSDIRFRLHRGLLDKANAVCARHGVELADVLRGVVTSIAVSGALPTPSGTKAPADTARLPFDDYDPRLWEAHHRPLRAELALELLASFIADCSAQLAETDDNRKPHAALAEQLVAKREEAIRIRRTLNVSDPGAVDNVLKAYGPKNGRVAS